MSGHNHKRAYQLAFTGSLALDPYSPFVPSHLRAAVKQRERHFDTERRRRVFASEANAIAKAFELIQEQCNGRAGRRQAENTIADYIEREILPHVSDEDPDADRLRWLPRDLRECRRTGVWGRCKHTGDTVIAWDSKCGDLRLCPDEAREEQQRLAEKYVPILQQLDDAGYKIQKAVLSPPNFADGSLRNAQQYVFRRFRAMLRKIARDDKRFPIAGALVVMESPLSSRGDWNVHLNVFFAIKPDTFFDWGEFRKAIGAWQCEFTTKQQMVETTSRRLLRRGDNLADFTTRDVFAHALLECIKYPVQTVAEKGSKHDGEWIDGVYTNADGKPVAPPLTHWPADRFLEWYRAQKGFRRTRGYGKDVLFGVAAPERAKMDLDQVEFFGQVRFAGGGYLVSLPLVDLIPGDNSPKVVGHVGEEVDNRGPPRREMSFRELIELEIIDQELTEGGL